MSERVAETATSLMQSPRPHLLLTSLFGIGAAALAAGPTPLVMVNSTFYVGPDPPRPPEADLSARALPLFDYLEPMEARATLVLHATDQVFDFDNQRLPPNHRYVGPLLWEPDGAAPEYLQSAGDPWVVATISSQIQDDVPLARAVLDAASSRSVRLLLTTGGSHARAELDPVPENARVEDYVSHRAALQRSRALISHAGHGSVMKALWYGVPMVVVPWAATSPALPLAPSGWAWHGWCLGPSSRQTQWGRRSMPSSKTRPLAKQLARTPLDYAGTIRSRSPVTRSKRSSATEPVPPQAPHAPMSPVAIPVGMITGAKNGIRLRRTPVLDIGSVEHWDQHPDGGNQDTDERSRLRQRGSLRRRQT